MKLPILISDPDENWTAELTKSLRLCKVTSVLAKNGSDCQLKLYNDDFSVLLIDLATKNHSAIEVLKYARQTKPTLKIILSIESQDKLKELGLKEDYLKRFGIAHILVKPFKVRDFLKSIGSEKYYDMWQLDLVDGNQLENEIKAKANEFTSVFPKAIEMDNTLFCDLFVATTPEKFKKITAKGSIPESKQFKDLDISEFSGSLFIHKNDRLMLINHLNRKMEKLIAEEKINSLLIFRILKLTIEKCVEEAFAGPIYEQFILQSTFLSKNASNFFPKIQNVGTLLKEYQSNDGSSFSHDFSVVFFSMLIAGALEWTSERTVELVTLGAILHDIGKLKLPENLRHYSAVKDVKANFEQYATHPERGMEMLLQNNNIQEPIRQIVYQHHEKVNGSGYPNGLSGNRIFPLAKIVSFADEVALTMITEELTPQKALEKIISSKNKIICFEPEMIKALITSFMDKSTKAQG